MKPQGIGSALPGMDAKLARRPRRFADDLTMDLVRNEVQAAQMFLKLYDSEISRRPEPGEPSVTLENVSLSLDIARRLLPRLNPRFAESVVLHLKEIEAKLAERASVPMSPGLGEPIPTVPN